MWRRKGVLWMYNGSWDSVGRALVVVWSNYIVAQIQERLYGTAAALCDRSPVYVPGGWCCRSESAKPASYFAASNTSFSLDATTFPRRLWSISIHMYIVAVRCGL